ncbi:integrase catalytic domain-containing protein [Trichonephila clavipes]|nr:integrase catalytic domain-containing protein [Trichonephila clavipes]
MQQICYILNIHQSLIPVYHPQANPVERKNMDLKPRLAILVQDKHDCWSEKLPFIRFAFNTAKCETTGQSAAFLNFGREIREVVEEQHDSRKFYADKKRKAAPAYQPGEHVFVASHPLSNAAHGRSAKLMPRRDGPNVILTQMSPSSYEIASLDNPGVPLGVYHASALIPCNNDKVKPIIPLRKRGHPPKVPQIPGSSSGRRRNQKGRMSIKEMNFLSRDNFELYSVKQISKRPRVKRVFVPPDKVSWSVPWPEYSPLTYSDGSLDIMPWADPDISK